MKEEYVVTHLPERQLFVTEVDGEQGFVEYRIVDGNLDITHTIVPMAIEGRGVAAALVKEAYDYARNNGLTPRATCSYAVMWLRRHPEYVS